MLKCPVECENLMQLLNKKNTHTEFIHAFSFGPVCLCVCMVEIKMIKIVIFYRFSKSLQSSGFLYETNKKKKKIALFFAIFISHSHALKCLC